ncbi:MAG: hypothetical protein BroJett040_07550 [Oligoflexia bacterium]|nr:MAG: hypothetical protein BroJett040_07550 [Oligoflexia bacterium]
MTLFFVLFSSFVQASTQPLHVMIDPGHGGTDTGAVRGKAREAEIALKVGTYLKTLLEQDSNYQASLTRTTDKSLSLQERVELAEELKADLFLSIHANAASDRRARGVEFYFQNHLPADEETLFLAATENKVAKSNALENQNTQDPTKKNDVLSIVEDLKRTHRMVSSHKLSKKLLMAWEETNPEIKNNSNIIRQAPFYVVSRANMPSVLIELGFLTNPKEADRLINPEYQKEIAQKIYRGLQKYKDLMDKSNLASLN